MSHLLQRLIARASAPISPVMPLLQSAYAQFNDMCAESGISEYRPLESEPADSTEVSVPTERVAETSQNDVDESTEIDHGGLPAVSAAGAPRRPDPTGAPRPLAIEPIVRTPPVVNGHEAAPVPARSPLSPARPSPPSFGPGAAGRSPQRPQEVLTGPERSPPTLKESRRMREEPPALRESPTDRAPPQPRNDRDPVVAAAWPDTPPRHQHAATHPSGAAQRSGIGPEQAAPIEVTVSIGHIEVRSTPNGPPPRHTPSRPRVTLEDFLNRRYRGETR